MPKDKYENDPSLNQRVFGQFAGELDDVERNNAAVMGMSNKKFSDEEIFDGATNPSGRLRSKLPGGKYREPPGHWDTETFSGKTRDESKGYCR